MLASPEKDTAARHWEMIGIQLEIRYLPGGITHIREMGDGNWIVEEDQQNRLFLRKPGANLGARATLSDIGQTVAENFGVRIEKGESFLSSLK